MDCFSFQLKGKGIKIYRKVSPYLNSNMYVMLTKGEAVVIDPCEDQELFSLYDENHIKMVHVLLTHEHYDHVSGVKWFKDNYHVILYCQRQCAKALASKRGSNPALVALVFADQDKQDGGHRYQNFKAQFEPYSIKVEKIFDKEDKFKIGELGFRVVSTPGHCPGAVCYELFDKMVFTGDTLLQNDPIILSFRESRKDNYEKIALPYLRSLPKDTIIMPGHGDPFILKDTKNI